MMILAKFYNHWECYGRLKEKINEKPLSIRPILQGTNKEIIISKSIYIIYIYAHARYNVKSGFHLLIRLSSKKLLFNDPITDVLCLVQK